MQTRYILITAITIVLGMIGIGGYLIPAKTSTLPARVVLENRGGRVIFSHLAHAEDYGFSCEDCHHEQKDLTPVLACGKCHPTQMSDSKKILVRADALHQQCMGCHEQSDSGPFGEESCNQCHPAL